ncbi:hypothetical protein V1283_003927 [Bradyrhizobium sp. AZCC 2262]
MPVIFDLRCRQYCNARLTQMRKQCCSALKTMKLQKQFTMRCIPAALVIG